MTCWTLLIAALGTGCGEASKPVVLPAGVSSDIAVLSLGADTSELTQDQVTLLQRTLDWMDRDIINCLNKKGFNAVLMSSEDNTIGESNRHLLKISVTSHRMIPTSGRIWGGMMAGTDRLNTHYDLVDANGKIVLSWDDTQASTKGGTYCAQTLNRNATNKIAAFLSGS